MPTKSNSHRLGLHYFPDGEHYQKQDLFRWLPIFQRLGIRWLTLAAPLSRAIPEYFIRGLLNQHIQPILHFVTPVDQPLDMHALKTIIRAYADWGIQKISFFDRPNLRLSWRTSSWTQNRLVDQFLDRYIPLGRLLLNCGITPIFPPLEPGGEYWDTTFLRLSLQGLERRGEIRLLEELHLGAYGYCHHHPWNWGEGGPERWPGARPYLTPPHEQDQRGFHIFDWYSAISRAILGRELPVFLLRAGEPRKALINSSDRKDLQEFLDIYRTLAAAPEDPLYQQLPDNLYGVCFWLLAAEPGSLYTSAAMFATDGSPNPVGSALLQYGDRQRSEVDTQTGTKNPLPQAFPLSQYVLVPRQANSPVVSQLRKLADPQKVAFGSSFLDAALARQVIVLGGPDQFPAQQMNLLSRAGCEVIPCSETGIELARMLVIR